MGEQFVMYPVMCSQVVSMVPVMMAPISVGNSDGIPPHFENAPHTWVLANAGYAENAEPHGVDKGALAPGLATGPEPSVTSVPIPQALTAAPSISSSCFRVKWNV